MSVTPTENTSKPGLFDRLVARITVDATAVHAELTEAVAALADAAAKVTALESEKVALTTAHAAEIEAMKAEHIKALEDAKIQGAQEFAAKGLIGNAPQAAAIMMAERPTPPEPCTATYSPGWTFATSTSPRMAVAKRQPSEAAVVKSIDAGRWMRLVSAKSTATYSANEPQAVKPGWNWFSQT